MKMKAEVMVMLSQVKEHQQLEEARKDPSLEVLEGARPYLHLDSGLLASRPIRFLLF